VPAARVEELPWGGVLFLTSATPVESRGDEARRVQAGALAHLRPDVDAAKHLEELRRRSRELAPAERTWDADVADLLELTLADVPIQDRQREVTRLNAYRPPEPAEWRPAAEAQPSDVANAGAAIERYETLAEQLTALLAKDLPEIDKGEPDVLPRIDYLFWHYDYPARFPRDDIESDLVPSVGAFVGDLMVQHLGGRWVPRRALDESQVVIGDRAWLPFLRARRYLKQKQNLLDFSLTKLFRTAARHR
jgi:hypothetical protein